MSFLLSRLGTISFANTIYPVVVAAEYFLNDGVFTWTAPETMVPGSLSAFVVGAGGSSYYPYSVTGTSGGGGGSIIATVSANPGTTLTVVVGSGSGFPDPAHTESAYGGDSWLGILDPTAPSNYTFIRRHKILVSAQGGRGYKGGSTFVNLGRTILSYTGVNGITGLNSVSDPPRTDNYIYRDDTSDLKAKPFVFLLPNGQPYDNVSFQVRAGGTQQWGRDDTFYNYDLDIPFYPGFGGCTVAVNNGNYTEAWRGRKGFVSLAYRYMPKPRPYIIKKEFAITANSDDTPNLDFGVIPLGGRTITSYEIDEYSFDPLIVDLVYYVSIKGNSSRTQGVGGNSGMGYFYVGRNIPVGVYTFTVNITIETKQVIEYHVTVRAV